MTGYSLLPILKNQLVGHGDDRRDFVVFDRERHVPAQQKPSMQGYPARVIRTDRWMLKLNFNLSSGPPAHLPARLTSQETSPNVTKDRPKTRPHLMT